MNWQVQRLVEEWMRHDKVVISVDFDDTLKPYSRLDAASVARTEHTIDLLQACQVLGARLVLNTCKGPEHYDRMIEFCTEHGLQVENINEGLPGMRFGTALGSKPYANIYLDDRAGIEETLNTLSCAYMIVSATKKNASTY